MSYKVEITENGKTWTLPADYTKEEAQWEMEMQKKLNYFNILLGEPPATIRIVETGKIVHLHPKRRDTI